MIDITDVAEEKKEEEKTGTITYEYQTTYLP